MKAKDKFQQLNETGGKWTVKFQAYKLSKAKKNQELIVSFFFIRPPTFHQTMGVKFTFKIFLQNLYINPVKAQYFQPKILYKTEQ